ncbi:hypothetical protein [Streptomyces rishiriensis]|uniref:hypothetical protein n=1 Tax=Streptomyces rishiriensis TaxID=68264 RepID=UPI0037CD6E1F
MLTTRIQPLGAFVDSRGNELNIKQRGILAAAGITAAALCVSVAPSAMADTSSTSTNPAVAVSAVSAKTDGENVFRGLFFGQGKVGRELADLDPCSEARQYIDNDSRRDPCVRHRRRGDQQAVTRLLRRPQRQGPQW